MLHQPTREGQPCLVLAPGKGEIIVRAGQIASLLDTAINVTDLGGVSGGGVSYGGLKTLSIALGPGNDLFFLSFEQFGSHLNPYVEPPVVHDPGPEEAQPRVLRRRDGGVQLLEGLRLQELAVAAGTFQASGAL